MFTLIFISFFIWSFFWLWIGVGVGEIKKRRDAGAILGLIFGPIGVLAAFFLEDRRRKCPACKLPIPDDAIRCGHCCTDLIT